MKFTMILALLTVGTMTGEGNTLPSELRRNGPLLREALTPLQTKFQDHSAALYDAATRKYFVYGTVMSADGLILTKASEVAEVSQFTVRIGKKHFREPKVLALDHQWDLALVQVSASDLKPIVWGSSEGLIRGTWVVSNGSTERRYRRVRPGIISANARKIEGPVLAVLGVQLEGEDGKVILRGVTKDSGAEKAGLKADDVVERVEGKSIASPDDLVEIIRKKNPGEKVDILVDRNGEKYSCQVELMPRHKFFKGPQSRNEQMSGIISARRDNFPKVLQHDTTMTARTMGGPLITLDGVFVGMNIACVSRPEAYAIPAEELQKAYAALKKKAGR